jgi:hypothetical protein
MALALWMWALECLLLYLDAAPGAREGLLYRAGLCLGLSVVANLAFAVPVAALGGAFCITALLWKRASAPVLAERLLVPAVVLAFLLLVLPVSHAEPEHFIWGCNSLRETVGSLAMLSVYHTRSSYPAAIASLGAIVSAACVGVTALLAAGLCAAVAALRRREKGSTAALLLLASGAMALSLGLVMAAHRMGGVPYPLSHTALCFIPMATLAGLALTARTGTRPLRAAAGLLAALILAQYLSQFSLRVYTEWVSESESGALVQALMRDAGRRPVSIAAGGAEEPVLSFYRERYRQRNWEQIVRGLPDRYFDYYVLTSEDAALVEKRHLRIIYKNPWLTLARSGG